MAKYRQGVAAIVLNNQNQVLICQRVGDHEHYQFPQGGIKAGENKRTALLRELKEEIGTNRVSILTKLPQKTCYRWPEFLQQTSEYIGQEHTWYVVRLEPGQDLLPSKEFSDFTWIEAKDIFKHTFFKRHETYELVVEMMKKETSLGIEW